MMWPSKQLLLIVIIILLLFSRCSHSLATGALLPRDKLTRVLKAEAEQMDSVRIDLLLDCAELAIRSWTTTSPDYFLSPAEMAATISAFAGVADVSVVFEGGYRLCERHRVFFQRAAEEGTVEDGRPAVENLEDYIAAVSVTGNFMFDKLQQDEFESAVYTVEGIFKDKIGDVQVISGDKGCHVLCAPEQITTLCKGLKSIRGVPVEVTPIPLAQISHRPVSRKELALVEASTRLDAIASAGFGLSRTKMVKIIEGGDVLINWKTVKSAAATLRSGDVILARAVGKLIIRDISQTSKGKQRVQCIKEA